MHSRFVGWPAYPRATELIRQSLRVEGSPSPRVAVERAGNDRGDPIGGDDKRLVEVDIAAVTLPAR